MLGRMNNPNWEESVQNRVATAAAEAGIGKRCAKGQDVHERQGAIVPTIFSVLRRLQLWVSSRRRHAGASLLAGVSCGQWRACWRCLHLASFAI